MRRGPALHVLRALAAPVQGAGAASAGLLAGACVLGLVNEEVIGLAAADLVLRGVLASVLLLAAGCAVVEPCRVALERALLLRAAERAEDAAPPTLQERVLLVRGPLPPLQALGVGASIGLALVALVVVAVALEDDDPAWAVGMPVGALSLLAIAVSLAVVARGRGPLAVRRAERLTTLAARWGRGAHPRPREVRVVAGRGLGALGTAAGLGAGTFFTGVVLRQPGRGVDPIRWDEGGELAIDGLVLLGGGALVAVSLVLLAVAAARLVRAALATRRVAAALARATEPLPPSPALDALLLDRTALERAGASLAVLGWGALALGLAPGWMAVIDGPGVAAGIAGLEALLAPAAALLAGSLLLALVGSVRGQRLRARARSLAAHDPFEGVAARRGEAQRAAEERAGLRAAIAQAEGG